MEGTPEKKQPTDKKNDNLASNAVAEGVRETSEQASQEEWSSWEKKVSLENKKVLDALNSLGTIVTKDEDTDASIEALLKKVLTDSYYLDIVRPSLVERKFVSKEIPIDPDIKVNNVDETDRTDTSNAKTKKGKKEKEHKKGKKEKEPSKKEKIMLESAESNIKHAFSSLFSTLNMNMMTAQTALKSPYIEGTGIGFIYMCRYMLAHEEVFREPGNVVQVKSLQISMQRFMKHCAEYKGVDPVVPGARATISKVLLLDMKNTYKDLEKVFKFDGRSTAQKYPDLINYAPLDEYIQATAISPRDHQTKIVKAVHQANKSAVGLFVMYNAMMNSGKTTAVVPLSIIASHHKKILLCVCNVKAVRDFMCRALSNAEVSFAFAYIKNGLLKISQIFSKRRQPIDVIVCGSEVAIKLLTDKSKGDPSEKYILFLDEPTVGADYRAPEKKDSDSDAEKSRKKEELRKKSETLRKNMMILVNAPKWTIYSSATAPPVRLFGKLLSLLKRKYHDLVVEEIGSRTIYVNCEVKADAGDIVHPFLGCKNRVDIFRAIESLDDLPYMNRMLTSGVVDSLYAELTKLNTPDVPNIPVLFDDVTNLKPEEIRRLFIQMINMLATIHSDEEIERICSSDILSVESTSAKSVASEKKHEEDDNIGFDFVVETKNTDVKETTPDKKLVPKKKVFFDHKQFGSGNVWKGPTLIATIDPCKYVDENTQDLFRKLTSEEHKDSSGKLFRYRSAEHAIEEHEKNISSWEEAMKKALPDKDKTKKGGNEKGSDSTDNSRGNNNKSKDDKLITSKADKALKESEFIDRRPKVKFPDTFQVGTKEYNSRLSRDERKLVVDNRMSFQPELITERMLTIGKKKQKVPFIQATKVDDKYITLLFAGIGIYSPTHPLLDNYYTELVAELSSEGKLAYVVSDISLAYGTNQPFTRVIVTDEFGKNHSIHTIIQLIARAGRVGKIAKAEAVVSPDIARTIVDFAVNPEKYYVELRNIEAMIDTLVLEEEQEILKQKSSIDQEIEQRQANLAKKLGLSFGDSDNDAKRSSVTFETINSTDDESIDSESTEINKSIKTTTDSGLVPDSESKSEPKFESWEEEADYTLADPTKSNSDSNSDSGSESKADPQADHQTDPQAGPAKKQPSMISISELKEYLKEEKEKSKSNEKKEISQKTERVDNTVKTSRYVPPSMRNREQEYQSDRSSSSADSSSNWRNRNSNSGSFDPPKTSNPVRRPDRDSSRDQGRTQSSSTSTSSKSMAWRR